MKKLIVMLLLACSIMLVGCPDPPDTNKPQPTDQFSKYFHHINRYAWHGLGTAVVFCADTPKYDFCVLDGRAMDYHGVDNCGGNCQPRHVYTHRFDKELTGVITCAKGQVTTAFMIEDVGKNMQWGECSGRSN